jgi:hypothetical protein
MAKGGYGLHKVLPGPAMPYPSTPCGWSTPETALHRAGGLQLASNLLDTPRRTPMIKTRRSVYLGTKLNKYKFIVNLGVRSLVSELILWVGGQLCRAPILAFNLIWILFIFGHKLLTSQITIQSKYEQNPMRLNPKIGLTELSTYPPDHESSLLYNLT